MDDRDSNANTTLLFAVLAFILVPAWVYAALISLPASALTVSLARSRSYLLLTGIMLLLIGVAARLDAPGWMFWVVISATIILIL